MKGRRDNLTATSDNRPRPPVPESIVCWSCLQDIPFACAGDLCPLCGAELTETAYDRAAKTLLEKSRALATEIGIATEQLSSAETLIQRLGLIDDLPLISTQKFTASLNDSIAEIREQNAQITDTLKQLAVSRYYASHWYHLTGEPLCDLGAPGDTPFGSPRYELGRAGTVRFNCKATKCSKRKEFVNAYYSEYETFCAVQQIVDSGTIGYARLLPHLLVTPNFDIPGYRRRDKTYEIDAVLVTEQAIVVIETKRTWMSVDISYDEKRRKHHITRTGTRKNGERFESMYPDHSPQQVFSHSRALLEAGIYSVQNKSLIGLVVYSGAPQVSMHCSQGEGTPPIYYASLESQSPDIERVLTDALSPRAPERCAAEVGAVADELFARYSDLDGSKLRAHRERLTRSLSTHPSTSKSTRPHSVDTRTRDLELEYMMSELWDKR